MPDAVESSGRPAKRARFVFRREDVNVERFDSVRLLVGGEVFHAQAAALEEASPLLCDMFAELMTPERLVERGAVPVPPVTGVDPALAHAAFSKAVEFVYTGTIEWGGDDTEEADGGEGEAAGLLPAVLATAHHLQMEALQDWCLEQLARRAAGPEGGREAAVRAALDGPAPREATLGWCRDLADACAAWAVEALGARAAAGGGASERGSASAPAPLDAWRGALQPAMEAWVCTVARMCSS